MKRVDPNRIRSVFDAVSDLAPEARERRLAEACGDDAVLRANVEQLLKAHDRFPSEATVRVPRAVGTDGPGDDSGPLNQHHRPTADAERLPHVPSYRLIRELDRGGMGVVYLAAQEEDGFKRKVAIKVLKRGLDSDDVLRRFDLERQLLSALNDPGIARLFDAGQLGDGRPYFVMEYVDGLTIDAYCDRHRLTIADRLQLFRRVCEAVHAAHRNLVVHRDLKPSNILVTEDGRPKLLDFGIAKLVNPELAIIAGDPTAPELRVMTPEYASPEQVRGDPITTASDVYSLGVLLYELLTGHRPYRLASRARAEMERVICEIEPERPSTAISRVERVRERDRAGGTTTEREITPDSVSRSRVSKPDRLRRRLAGDIDNIVLKAMRKEPQRRYASAEQLAADIDRHLESQPVIARPATLWYRASKFIRRNRAGTAAAAAIFALLLWGLGATAMAWRGSEAERQRTQAALETAETERARADERLQESLTLARILLFEFPDTIQTLSGSLAARELLVTTGLQHLERLEAELERTEDRDNVLLEIAKGYDRLGDVWGGGRNPSIGSLDDAFAYYRKAIETRQRLSTAAAATPEARRATSTSHIRMGDVLRKTGRTSEALAAYQEGLRIRRDLRTENPIDWQKRRDVAIALLTVGDALLDTGERESGMQHYQQSLKLREVLARERPDDPETQRDLSVAYLRVAGEHSARGDHELALAESTEALEIRKRLAESNPHSSRWQRDRAVTQYFVGVELLALERYEEAIEHLERFQATTRRRAEENPESARAQRDAALAHQVLGEAQMKLGAWDAAIEQYETFRGRVRQLVDAHPTDTRYPTLLAEAHLGLGAAHAASGAAETAVHHGREAEIIARALTSADAVDADAHALYARSLLSLGVWMAESGEAAEARTHLRKARELFERLLATQPTNVSLTDGLTQTQRALETLGPEP